MGRPGTGMEDDGPIADTCDMPSFISSFEEGRVKVSRNLPTQTSLTDGKVERPVRDLNRRVTRTNSRLSLDGGERERSGEEEEEVEEEEEKDAEGNNNNNCNGGGGRRRASKRRRRRRRASAVEIWRRNLGDRSPSLRLNTNSRMQRGDSEQDTRHGCAKNGHGTEGGERHKQPDGEAGTNSECSAVTCQRHHMGNSEESHVYCTVYCIANDNHGGDGEITARGDAVTPDGVEMDLETGQDADDDDDGGGGGGGDGDPSPEPALYTLDDLVDPFGVLSHRLFVEQAGAEVQSCRVCLEEKTVASLPCCRKAVCDECLKLYVSSQVRVAKALISCPIPECSGNLEEGVVMSHLANEDMAKYRYFLELSQLDASTKPCPQCSQFTSLRTHNPNRSEHKYKIQCSNCQFVWCFKCHAPWHNGLKCREYRKGDKLLRTWASVIEHGQRNAQKCPQCKIHIQRIEGCDHMTCTQCNTNFCYRCGERYRHLRFFGDHTSNLSVFGCKYRYLPDKPHLRRLVRGSVCATKVLIAPVVILLVVVLGALALVIGLVFFPVYYACMRIKKQRTRGSVQCF
ncbi:E3 ubiquitin-protein ligase RNF217 [Parambassis ranga]|uniref:E3 ubiquitin-protein ligase RNF217 n=1 Tax=Parambassis ranga TaxID=210632 RepID=A0A6P7HUV1_9TELE|nr:probable E3 ubiquitin-protein ligase RNF217 [Parambassis ranga]